MSDQAERRARPAPSLRRGEGWGDGASRAALVLAFFALSIGVSVARAETYPNRPIRIVTPFSPGGGVEVTLRFLVQKLGESGWANIVVENRPGGGGAVAAGTAKSAAADGYTFLQADIGTFAILPLLATNLGYDPLQDFRPITLTFSFPSLVVVPAASPANSVAELVALAKSKPGGLSYASQGTSSGGHILGAMFAKASGAPMTHVPYRGAAPAMIDLAAGRADVMFTTLASIRSVLRDGKVKVIGTTARQRAPEFPNMLTMTEAGYPDVFLDAWFGIAAPAGLSDELTTTIHEKFVAVMNRPEVRQRLADQGFEAVTSTADEFHKLIKSELERLAPIVKAAVAAGSQ